MKKILSVVIVLVLLLMTGVCYGENNTGEYEVKMKGTWELDSMSIIATGNLFNDSHFSEITFPRIYSWVSGDETGKVYLTINAGFMALRSEVTFTSDYNTMVLIDADGSRIILNKK